MTIWRYIPLLAAPGTLQMALDRWLFEQHRLGVHPPTLRFYTWSPAAISLGFHQRHFPEHWRSLPLDLVRRPSGGRAVLHQGDLTYAVVTSGLAGSRMAAYQQVCQFLLEGWRSLHYPLHFGSAGRGYIHNPNCFGTATAADLVLADGTKLVGSAQLRQGNTVLQHGSMRLHPDPLLFEQVFGEKLESPFSLEIAPEKVIAALKNAATECFGVQWEERSLTEAEWDEVRALMPLYPVAIAAQ